MTEFNQKAFEQFIIESRVVGFFDKPVTLKSGRTSHWYCNWRTVTNDVFLLDVLSDHIIAFLRQKDFKQNCVYGVPEGATKTALLTQYKWARQQPGFGPGTHGLPMGRGKTKVHGAPEDKFFVGMPQGRTVVLEDVTTTGGSLIEAVKQLQESQVDVAAMVGLTNRMETPLESQEGKSVEERLKKHYPNIPYFALSTAETLLPHAVRTLQPKKEIIHALEREYATYGVIPIKF